MQSDRPTTRLAAVERRSQLLEAALATFGAEGFNTTSMNDVALAAGVTKPVLYQHFDSKHHLYLELLSDIRSELVQRLDDVVGSADGPREQVELAFAEYFMFFAEEPCRFTVMYGEGVRSDPHFIEELQAVEDSFVSFTADFIEIEGMARDDRLLLARAVAGLLEAALRQWIQAGQRRNALELAELMSELAWRGLRGLAGTETTVRVRP